ncbi:unnamed protein product, partial [Protopolystoma xenopodis]
MKSCVAAPSAPLKLRVAGYSFSEITVEWQRPTVSNGILEGYIVKVVNTVTGSTVIRLSIGQADNPTTVYNLEPRTNYTITVAAVTQPNTEGMGGGQGPFSDGVNQTTAPG